MAKQGDFFWCDVMTTDTKAAGEFYSKVVGWGVIESGSPDMDYQLFTVQGQAVAGLMPVPPDAGGGARPCWMSYIYVADLEASIEKIRQAGGSLHHGPREAPGIIRFAVVSDPQGAVFLVATPLRDEPMPEIPPRTQGTVGWHELYAGDGPAAFTFYETVFGWTKDVAMPMGEMGVYQLFKTGGDQAAGGVMTKSPQMPVPFWGVYFHVDSLDAAVERVKAGGGQVAHGPTEVPGGDFIAQFFDPQGAFFALVGPR